MYFRLDSPVNLTGLFLDWEEAGVPRENSHSREHANSTQTGPAKLRFSIPEPSGCEATLLSAALSPRFSLKRAKMFGTVNGYNNVLLYTKLVSMACL